MPRAAPRAILPLSGEKVNSSFLKTSESVEASSKTSLGLSACSGSLASLNNKVHATSLENCCFQTKKCFQQEACAESGTSFSGVETSLQPPDMLQERAVASLHHLWPVCVRLVLLGKESSSVELSLDVRPLPDGCRMKWERWESNSSQFLIELKVLNVLL